MENSLWDTIIDGLQDRIPVITVSLSIISNTGSGLYPPTLCY
jgi:hypothetical protein